MHSTMRDCLASPARMARESARITESLCVASVCSVVLLSYMYCALPWYVGLIFFFCCAVLDRAILHCVKLFVVFWAVMCARCEMWQVLCFLCCAASRCAARYCAPYWCVLCCVIWHEVCCSVLLCCVKLCWVVPCCAGLCLLNMLLFVMCSVLPR